MLWALPATTDYAARAAVTQGYNSNVAIIASGDQYAQNPALFTGLDVAFQIKRRGRRAGDEQSIDLGGRARYYVPLGDFTPQHDGLGYVRLTGAWALSPRSYFSAAVGNSILTLNAATPGDPNYRASAFQSRSVQSFGTVMASLTYEMSSRWNVSIGTGSLINFTLDDPVEILLPDGSKTKRRGLDGLIPYGQALLNYAINDKHSLNWMARYDYTYAPMAVDYSSQPPKSLGVFDTHMGTFAVGHGYNSPKTGFNVSSRLGGTISTPAPLDTDNRVILAPYVQETIGYSRDEHIFRVMGTYYYGSPFPRVGSGLNIYGTAEYIRGQSPHGAWSKWMVLTGADAGYSEGQITSTLITKSAMIGGFFEGRRLLVRNLSIGAGYAYRRTVVGGDVPIPEINQHLAYIGLAYFFSTDIRVAPLATLEPAPLAH